MRKMKFVFVLAVLATCALAQAAYIGSTDQGGIVPIINQGFENPADGKHNAWDIENNAKGNFLTDVPGWSSDWTANDSGVELTGGGTGLYHAFIMNGPDPSVWNITGYKIHAGDQFMLKLDARNNWTGQDALNTIVPQLQMTLFYVGNGGVRNVLATQVVNVDLNIQYNWGGSWSDWTTYTLDVPDASAGVGKLLGIELQNITTDVWGAGSSWLNMDQVRLVPEPATLILLGLGGILLRRKR